MEILSPLPLVKLTQAFLDPYNNAVATARTCYSSRIISNHDVQKDEAAKVLRDNIAQSTYQAGHHTTLQHAHFQFSFENISRHALWSFFHAHPFYNSEQVSQRYVEVKPNRVLIPKLPHETLQKRYENALHRQMEVYKKLLECLHGPAEEAYFRIYPGRLKNKTDKRWQGAIQKRCQEVARYVLCIGTHSHLYHTISGLTLHRYHRLAQSGDCPTEQALVVKSMVDQVTQMDPLFFKHIESMLPHEDLLEQKIQKTFPPLSTVKWIHEFDQKLGSKTSLLTHMPLESQTILGQGLRDIFGVSKEHLSDEAALEWLLDPQKNTYLGEALNLNTLSKTTRVLELVQISFMKKLSHCADSQAQRHRMIPSPRPLLFTHVQDNPDFITPLLFDHPLAKEAKLIYTQEMETIFEDIFYLKKNGVEPEIWQYLIPNSFPIRYTDTASLMDHHHKWSTRLCYNAQEEIWKSCHDEVMQVIQAFPPIGKWLLPPCGLRARSGQTPVCPEGIRFCGTPVWRLKQSDYKRDL